VASGSIITNSEVPARRTYSNKLIAPRSILHSPAGMTGASTASRIP
jgi:hypothetical protein